MNHLHESVQQAVRNGLERTRLEAERKAIQEKSDVRDFIMMADEIKIEEALLSIDQVATQLGVSSQTVRNWESQGVLIPVHKTEGGHRRYTQSQIVEFKRSQNDYEIFLRIEPKRLKVMIEQVLSNFCPEEKICISIRNDQMNRQVHLTLDSEDGLCTFTKTMKMEE